MGGGRGRTGGQKIRETWAAVPGSRRNTGVKGWNGPICPGIMDPVVCLSLFCLEEYLW